MTAGSFTAVEAAAISPSTIARATARLASARELLAQTRARLGDTRTLIALNRRWLNRGGGSRAALNTMVKERSSSPYSIAYSEAF